jgi:hypothetical protein
VCYYDAPSGRLPALPCAYDGVIVTGSPAGVYERGALPWIAGLEAWLRAALAPPAATRVVGGCFGAQVIASALGGLVEPQGFVVLGAEALTPTPALAAEPWARGLIGLGPAGGAVVLPPADAPSDGYAPLAGRAGGLAGGGPVMRVLECQ